MTDITQTADHYPEGVHLLAVTDPVLGGPEGPDNKAPIALANRTHYQRMRNVTPWRAGVQNEYPAHAYVHHGGTTWKSKVANANVEPGTDGTKWIRWAYTSDELQAILEAYALDTDLAAYLQISQLLPAQIAYQQSYGVPEIITTHVPWADAVANAAGSVRLGTVVTRTFTNTASVPRKVLVQYFGTAAVHNALTPAVGVLGYAERSINGGAYGLFVNSQYSIMQCNSGGFANESAAGSGMASEVFAVAPGAALTLACRQKLNFYIACTGNNTDIAYERGSWSFTFF